MRSFEERKAEVLSRSEAAIVKRKANIKRIKTAVATLTVCVSILLGYNVVDNIRNPQTNGENRRPSHICSSPDEQQNELKISPTLAAMIKEQYAEEHAVETAHADITVDDILISNYKGFFNGTMVLMVNCRCESYANKGHFEIVGGAKINYPDGRSYTVWDGEAFYTLKEAYEKSILSINDIEEIATKNIT